MTPDDVYAAVQKMQTVLYVLCALIVLQIIAKIVILGRVIVLMHRVEILLGMVETHAKVSDSRQDRVERAAATAASQAATAREEIPRKVAELLSNTAASALSGESLPVVAPPGTTIWKPGDPDRRGPQP